MVWEVNHDELAELASKDPEAFKAKRKQIIDEYIDTLPEQQRVKAILHQQSIDVALDNESSPAGRLDKIAELMHSSSIELQDALKNLQSKFK